jgi:hypothetical protein
LPRLKTFLKCEKKRSLKLKKCFKKSGKEITKYPDIDSNASVPKVYVVSGKLPGESEEAKECHQRPLLIIIAMYQENRRYTILTFVLQARPTELRHK